MVDPDVRVSWGDYLQRPALEGWAIEHLTDFNTWVRFVHTTIIFVDQLTEAPTIITGSANYSGNSTTDNEENSIVIRGDGSGVAKRVADIYLTEYQRLFMHFVFRSWANRDPSGASAAGRLAEDDSWTAPYYVPGGWGSGSAGRSRAPTSHANEPGPSKDSARMTVGKEDEARQGGGRSPI